jgi:hypothetical protein
MEASLSNLDAVMQKITPNVDVKYFLIALLTKTGVCSTAWKVWQHLLAIP